MMLNDRIGDCSCAGAGHAIQQWTTYAGDPLVPTDEQVEAAYSAISGYAPEDPSTDTGCVLLDVLKYWRKTGVAARRIDAFASLEPRNHHDVMDAIYLFGNAYLGVALPISAQEQTVWTVPAGGATGDGAPGSWGGHCIIVVEYDPRGLTCVTWGATKRMSWSFFDAYCDEAYAVMSHDWLKGGYNPEHFDAAALQADLAAL